MNKKWRTKTNMEEQKEERLLHRMVRELCQEMDIKFEKLSFGWILQLSKNGQVRHITDNMFDNNMLASGTIVSDKYATYEVLKSQNIPIIEHHMIFNPATRSALVPEESNYKLIENEFFKYGKLVVKPNDECEGKGIELCNSLRETEIAIQKLFNKNHASVSICPFYDIKNEYRTFYLNGEVLLIYSKTKPFVVGDGKSTLGELIVDLQLPSKSVVTDNLSKLDLEYVPKQGENVEISWKFNLSGGATPSILEKGELYNKIEELAISAGKAVNINFATVDIIQTMDNNFYVMEINSGVCGKIFAELVERSDMTN